MAKSNILQFDDIVKEIVARIDAEEKNVSFSVDAQLKRADNNFEITHRDDLAELVEASGSPFCIVEAYLIRKAKMDYNICFCTLDKISKDTGVSRRTVSRVMIALQNKNIIRKVADGVWALRPRIMRKGGDAKFIALSRYYDSLKKPD